MCHGHNSIPLFDMISLDHWIPDELHIMLRITDRLWTLVLHEIKETGFFNDIARFCNFLILAKFYHQHKQEQLECYGMDFMICI